MIPFLCPKQKPHAQNVATMMPITGQSKQEGETKAQRSSIDAQNASIPGATMAARIKAPTNSYSIQNTIIPK